MPNIQGRGVRIEVGATFGTAINVTAVTLANPGVATATAHGQANGTVGFWTVTGGMPQLDGQATRVVATAANNFTLQGLDTTGYSAYTSGTFTPVATWASLAEATSYSIGGGATDSLDATRLIDVIRQQENGLLAAQTISINTLSQDVPSAAQVLLNSAALSGSFLTFRITLQTGAVRVFRGQVSLPGEDVQQGQLGTGSIQITTKGVVCFGAA